MSGEDDEERDWPSHGLYTRGWGPAVWEGKMNWRRLWRARILDAVRANAFGLRDDRRLG